ncbi:unnamed protein product [Paramecium primaurelia]|uniref:Protein kinase domain-containing protein n=1 Tax=Paramecium primaurelia TaxID=5886 RepID=A0A8S1MRS1_PARPR|nr:unnamed protein product [Paramecium primaurelia]
MICKRRKCLFDQHYFLYLTESSIQIGKDQSNIKYDITIGLSTILEWKLDQHKQFKGFTIDIAKKEKYFLVSHLDCLFLKEQLDGKVVYKNINTFYKPQTIIGEGNFGKVLLIKNIQDGKMYATKTLRNDLMTSLDDIQDEIVALQSLKHRNVVQLKSIFQHKKYWLLIMEYCEGGQLKEYLENNSLDSSEIIAVMCQLLSGLAYIHSQGFVHRDIKPENILLRKKDSLLDIVISDFGFAVKIDDVSTNRPRCGTPGYIAPEIITFDQKNNYNELCDMFSCGVVLFKLITGKNLLQENSNQIIDQQLIGDLSEVIKQEIQGEFAKILLQMLEQDPSKRITAEQALKHFEDFDDMKLYQETPIQQLKHLAIHFLFVN